MSTAGAPQVGTLNPFVRQEAETIAFESGVETEAITAGGRSVSFIDNGDWIKVKGVAFGTGASAFTARVASATSGGRIELRLDSSTGVLAGTCTVPGTGGWQTWTEVTCPATASGTHDLYLRFTGGSGSLFNVDRWQFAPADPAPTDPAPVPGAGCAATYRTTNTWAGGFQAEVTVTAGSSAVNGWRVAWTTASGQSISQVWNGTLSTSGATATVTDTDYNRSLSPNASTTFGFLAGGSPSTPSLTCTG
jgi:arabinoxylan arabinofuranohydrolase